MMDGQIFTMNLNSILFYLLFQLAVEIYGLEIIVN